MLDQEYQGRFSDAKMALVDRQLLEEEYRAKREALKVAEFSLNFLRHETTGSVPKGLASKVLTDILTTWAENADLFGDIGFAFEVSFLNKCDETERGIVAEFYQRCFGKELAQGHNVVMN